MDNEEDLLCDRDGAVTNGENSASISRELSSLCMCSPQTELSVVIL